MTSYIQGSQICQMETDGTTACVPAPQESTPSFFDQAEPYIWGVGYIILVWIVLAWVWGLWLKPIWSVWAAHKRGLADLAQARNEQAIQVARAQARFDAAELNKRAAIVEAEAVAAQIKEIGEGLKQHDLYLRWQWIKMMEERDGDETIYVPTEANLPILEAGRLR